MDIALTIQYDEHARLLPGEALLDIDGWIEQKESELMVCDLNQVYTRGRLLVLGLCFEQRYHQSKSCKDLSASIRSLTDCCDQRYPTDAVYYELLRITLALVLERFRTSGFIVDLDTALTLVSKSLCQSGKESEHFYERSIFFNNLLYHRYETSHCARDLDVAISFGIQLASEDKIHLFGKHKVLRNLSFYMDSKFKVSQNIQDLRKGLAWATRALDLNIPSCANEDANQIHHIFIALHDACHEKNTQVLVDEIDVLGRAMERLEIDVVTKRRLLSQRARSSLAIYLKFHYEWSRDGVQTDTKSYRSTISGTEEGFLEHMSWIANALRALYNISKNRIDLDAAVVLHDQMQSRLPNEPQQRLEWLTSFLFLLGRYVKHHFSIPVLQKWIKTAEKCLKCMSPENVDYPPLMGNLGVRYRECYDMLSEQTYLLKAIQWGRKAVEVVGHDRNLTQRSTLVHYQLAMTLHKWFERESDLKILDEARCLIEHSISTYSGDDASKAEFLDSLGNNLRLRYKSTTNIECLQESITKIEEAIRLAPNDKQLSGFRQNLGLSLKLRHEKLGSSHDLSDLEKAIEETKKSLAGSLEEYKRADRLYNLGIFAAGRLGITGAKEDEDLVLSSFRQGADLRGARPFIRITMARRAAELLRLRGRWNESWQCVCQAVELIPLLSPRHLPWEEQQSLLQNLSGLSSEACSTALCAGLSGYEAIRISELGRGVILSYSNEINSDISLLRNERKDLYEEYEHAKEALNAPQETGAWIDGTSGQTEAVEESSRDLRLAAFEKLGQTIDRIRKLPKFVTFLLPPSEAELISLARNGYIVLLNQSKFRSDALVVSSDGILAPLRIPVDENLSLERINRVIYQKLVKGSRKTFEDRNSSLRGALAKIWIMIVGPICDYLHLDRTSVFGHLPRIWWVATGQFSRLPLHAAGTYERDTFNFIYSRAISSYISTIRLLRHTREKSRGANLKILKGLFATVPKVPGRKELTFAIKEKEEVLQIKEPIQWRHLPNPNATQLMNSLSDCQILHLACHGVSDGRDPSKSHLLLRSTSDSSEILTVQTISKVVTGNGVLAFLSACSTVDNSKEDLLDECLQIGTAFQLAGFPHVIGTMWQAYDSVCPFLAQAFYGYLAGYKEDERNDSTYAQCYHGALGSLMVKYNQQPLFWAPFVHLGP